MNLILKAANFARQAHEGQFRKYTGAPYIEHPARVAGLATVYLYDHPQIEEIIAAAWLHDVIEDTPYTADTMEREGFSPFTIGLVDSLTNPSKGLRAPRAVRKQMDREHIAKAGLTAQALKLIDRLDNLREMAGADGDFRSLYAKETRLLMAVISNGEPMRQLKGEIIEVIGAE